MNIKKFISWLYEGHEEHIAAVAFVVAVFIYSIYMIARCLVLWCQQWT